VNILFIARNHLKPVKSVDRAPIIFPIACSLGANQKVPVCANLKEPLIAQQVVSDSAKTTVTDWSARKEEDFGILLLGSDRLAVIEHCSQGAELGGH